MLDRLFHIAINSTDLERSVGFYKRLGFQVLSEREVHNPAVMQAFAVPTASFRTRAITPTRSVTLIAPRASRVLKMFEHLSTWSYVGSSGKRDLSIVFL